MSDLGQQIFVFVLMPFSERFRDVYEVGIKAACKNIGVVCERVDEQHFECIILEQIYSQIRKADIIVADMTTRNANVFYETGYAHALKKRVILIAQNKKDIPFDLNQYPFIIYSGTGKITLLREKLEEKLKHMIPAIAKPFYVKEGMELYITHQLKPETQSYSLSVNIYNNMRKTYDSDSLGLAMIVDKEVQISSPSVLSSVQLPEGAYIHNLMIDWKIGWKLFPIGWGSLTVNFKFLERLNENSPTKIIMRVLTDEGHWDFSHALGLSDRN